jgi:hypothetical protein
VITTSTPVQVLQQTDGDRNGFSPDILAHGQPTLPHQLPGPAIVLSPPTEQDMDADTMPDNQNPSEPSYHTNDHKVERNAPPTTSPQADVAAEPLPMLPSTVQPLVYEPHRDDHPMNPSDVETDAIVNRNRVQLSNPFSLKCIQCASFVMIDNYGMPLPLTWFEVPSQSLQYTYFGLLL